jgi:hypothetical protein
MNDDRIKFEERIKLLKTLDPTSSRYERVYMLAAIAAAIYNWGVIDALIKEGQS